MFFHRRFKIKKDMIPNIRPTSKAALKQMCLISANGDIDKAQKLYEYMIKDMEDLPLFDIPEPTRMQQVKNGLSETWDWFNKNEEQILGFVDVISLMFNKKKNGGGTPPSAVANVTNPIPPIN